MENHLKLDMGALCICCRIHVLTQGLVHILIMFFFLSLSLFSLSRAFVFVPVYLPTHPKNKTIETKTFSRISPMQIRVVNAFRQGVDPRLMERTNPALAAVLQRQASASLAKRLSQASSIDYADAPGATGIGERERDYLAPEVDMERLSSRSHTETAV